MIEETDTDIEVRKYADAQAARELGIELYPRAAGGTSINPLPTDDFDQYVADLRAAVDTFTDPAVGLVAGARQGAQELIDSGIDFLGSEASKFFQYGGFHKAVGMTDEAGAEIYRDMELNTRKHLNERGLDTELPLSSLQPDTEIGIGIREMTAYVSNFLLGRPQFTKVKGLGDSVLDTVGDWGYRLLSNVRANSLGAHALSPEESNLSQLAVEMGFVQELNDFYAEGSVADRMSESVADRIAMTANPSVRGMDLDAEQRLLRKVDTIVEDNAAAGVLTGAIMTAAKAFKMAKANPKTTGAVVGGAAMAPEDGETSPLSAAGRAAKPAMSTADNMGGAARAADNAADLDDLGFFSQAQRAAEGLGMDSGTGEQFLAMLKKAGVKEDELKWTGLDELLAQDRVTKQEIVDHIRDNRVELVEEVLEDPALADVPSGNPDGVAQFLENSEEILDDPENYEWRAEDWVYDMNRIDPDAADDIEDEYWWDSFVKQLISETGASTTANDIIAKIKMEGYDSLTGIERRDADDALFAVAREEYMEEPYVRIRDISGSYEIVGNNEMGWRVTSLDRNQDLTEDFVDSLNEAKVQAERDAYDHGYIMDAEDFTQEEGYALWKDYTQPGGENYREILLSMGPKYEGDPDRLTIALPSAEQQELLDLQEGFRRGDKMTDEQTDRLAELMQAEMGLKYKQRSLSEFEYGGHYDTANLVVHARVSDRSDTSGAKVLYIEELQSDWAQRGRKEGFYVKDSRDGYYITQDMDELFAGKFPQAVIDHFDISKTELQSTFRNNPNMEVLRVLRARSNGNDEYANLSTLNDVAKLMAKQAPETEAGEVAQRLLDLDAEARGSRGITKGPFVTSTDKWVTVAMKRLLRQAIEGGYDYVAWTPGQVQVDRWRTPGLGDAYDKVIPKNSQKLVDRIDKGTKLEVIQIDMPNNSRSTFRSEIAPKAQDTLAIPITDAMRNQAPGGLPLFSGAGAAVVGGGAAVSQRKGDDRQMEMQF